MMQRSLKEQNQWNLFVFLIINFLILVYTRIIQLDTITIHIILTLLLLRGLILFPITVYVINGLIDSNSKAKLVFWKSKNPLPGSRAFSELIYTDSRINIDSLKLKYTLPSDPVEQNRLWYGIYKKHRNDITVNDSQKNYLLLRDISIISFLFLILYLVYLAIFRSILNSDIAYLSFLILQYVGLAYVAQHYGKRFVCNVLAEES